MLFILQYLLSAATVFALQCEPNQIYIREQWINGYTKSYGTTVDAHLRKAHCRELNRTDYFQDSTTQKIKNSNIHFQKWKPEEKKAVDDFLHNIPFWLQKYTIEQILRANSDGSKNPASSIALTKTIIIFDSFFKSANQAQVITHEVAHLTVIDLSQKELIDFANSSGWVIDRSKGIKIPPENLIMPDSSESVLEDYANHIEMYHFSPTELKRFNFKSFTVIDEIVKKRGHK